MPEEKNSTDETLIPHYWECPQDMFVYVTAFKQSQLEILFLWKCKHLHILSSFQLRCLIAYFSETLEESFKESQLVQSLHKLLQDDNTSAEVKYNSMSLLCSLLNSGNFILSTLVMQRWMFVIEVFAVSETYHPCDTTISEQ